MPPILKSLRRIARGSTVACPTSPWVLVHSMGKVGSYATYKAIEATGRYNVVHTHQLNPATIRKYRRQTGHAIGHITEALRFLEHVREEDEVALIVSIREPIARNVSAFFENLRFFDLDGAPATDVDRVVLQFVDRYPHQLPLNWFEDQVEAPFGIDLLALGAKTNEACSRGRLSILVQRSEDPDAEREIALRQFLGCEGIRLRRMNEGGKKPYAELYHAFRKKFRAPSEMLRTLYDSHYVRAFYSDDEIAQFQATWTDPETLR